MPSDSDPIQSLRAPDDMFTVCLHIIDGIQFKFLIIFFLAFLGVSSDVFINRVLSNFDNAVDMKYPTNYGTVIQGIFLVIIIVITNGLIAQKII